MKLLLDMNLSPTWVGFLEEARARDRGFVVMTHDLDFSALLAYTEGVGPSVLQVRTHDVLPASRVRVLPVGERKVAKLAAIGVQHCCSLMFPTDTMTEMLEQMVVRGAGRAARVTSSSPAISARMRQCSRRAARIA